LVPLLAVVFAVTCCPLPAPEGEARNPQHTGQRHDDRQRMKQKQVGYAWLRGSRVAGVRQRVRDRRCQQRRKQL
jgi:hypothetical protein